MPAGGKMYDYTKSMHSTVKTKTVRKPGDVEYVECSSAYNPGIYGGNPTSGKTTNPRNHKRGY